MEATANIEGMGGHRSSHFLRQGQGFVSLQLWQDRHEFLAAPASHCIDAPQLCPDQACKLTQHNIASRMPVAIIKRFEMIEVEEQQRAIPLVPLRAFQFLVELGKQGPVIGQLGDRIGRRQGQHALLEHALLFLRLFALSNLRLGFPLETSIIQH